MGAGTATVVLADRGLRATAEAVGVVTAALALATFEGARDLLLTEADPWLAWAFGCGVVALVAGRIWDYVARVRAPIIVALFLGQLCVPLVLAGSTPPILVVALAALWLAVADVRVGDGSRPTDSPRFRRWPVPSAAVAWLTSVLVGTALLFESPGLATSPLRCSLRWRRRRVAGVVASGAAELVGRGGGGRDGEHRAGHDRRDAGAGRRNARSGCRSRSSPEGSRSGCRPDPTTGWSR